MNEGIFSDLYFNKLPPLRSLTTERYRHKIRQLSQINSPILSLANQNTFHTSSQNSNSNSNFNFQSILTTYNKFSAVFSRWKSFKNL